MISSDFNILLAGKQKFNPVWKLQVAVEPILSVDNVLFPVEEYLRRFAENMYTAESLTFEVLYDSAVVGKTNFPNNKKQNFQIEVDDTVDFNKHLLEFRLSGKNDNHSYHDEHGNDVTWVLKYDFFIEDLPMTMLSYNIANPLENHVSYVIGQNQAEAIEIETPIYSWLVKHSTQIIRDLELAANEPIPTI